MIQKILRQGAAFGTALFAAATIGTVSAHAECTLEMAGTVPVTTTQVASHGTLAVIAAGGRTLTLVDLSGLAPVAGQTIATNRNVAGLLSVDVPLLVSDGSGGEVATPTSLLFAVESEGGAGAVEIYLTVDPANPSFVGSADLSSPGTSAVLRVVGTGTSAEAFLMVAGRQGSAGTIDVFKLDPHTAVPTKVATHTTAGAPVSLSINGSTVVAALGSAGIEVVDVSQPATPARMAVLAIPGGALEVSTGGSAGMFFVAAGTTGFHVVDASTNSAPVIAKTEAPGAGASQVLSVSARGNTLALGLGSAGFSLWDVTIPTLPTRIAGSDTPGTGEKVLYAGSVVGSSLVLVADGASGLQTWDVSYCLCSRRNGATPDRTIRLTTAYAARTWLAWGIDGASKFVVTSLNPESVNSALVRKGSIDLGFVPAALASTTGSPYAYVVGSTDAGQGKLAVVDASNPNAPTIASTQNVDFRPNAAVLMGGDLFLGGASGAGTSPDGIVRAYEIVSATAPVAKGQLVIANSGTSAAVVDLGSSDPVLVAGTATAGLVVVDPSNIDAPARIATYTPAGRVHSASAYQSVVYLSVDGVGIEMIDLSTPTAPAKVSTLAMNPAPARVSAFYGRVGASLAGAGFALYDTFDPSHTGLIESIDTEGSTRDLALVAVGPGTTFLLAADQDGGLLSYNFSSCIATVQAPVAAFTVTPETPIAGQAAQFTDNSRNTPTAWHWDFGDGTTSSERNPQHVFTAAGLRQVVLQASSIAGSSTTSRWIFVDGATGNPATGYENVWYVPASARAAGANNTQWGTDLAVLNRTGATARLFLSFLAAGRNNSSAVPTSMVTVPPGASVDLTNVVETRFGKTSAAGGIQVASDVSSLLITSRTFNSGGGNGTFGQAIPGESPEDGLLLGQTGLLIQLSGSTDPASGFRTNVGFLNGSASTVKVEVTLRGGDGAALGAAKEYTLQPFDYQQITDVFAKFGVGTVSNARAEVRVKEGPGPVFAYASVVDNKSGDPVYQPATR